jgi:hypothetical protein
LQEKDKGGMRMREKVVLGDVVFHIFLKKMKFENEIYIELYIRITSGFHGWAPHREIFKTSDECIFKAYLFNVFS